MKDTNYIYGRNAVIEALNSGSGLEKIFLIYGAKGKAIELIKIKSRNQGIPCSQISKQKFIDLEKKVCPKGSKAQGVLAQNEIVSKTSVENLIKLSFEREKNPVVVLLDEINDPHNLGAIARSVECSGAIGIIIPERNSAPVTPAALKASAGSLEHIIIAGTKNTIQAIERLKEHGFWIYATDMVADNFYYENIYNNPCAIIIGNEGKGVRPSTLKHCDYKIKIPMKGKIDSLNASVSAGIILFEIMRQRADN